MADKDERPICKVVDSSYVSIRGNTISGNNRPFVELEDSENVEVSHNTVNPDTQLLRGKRVKDLIVHSNLQRSPSELEQFINIASPHFHELTTEQQERFLAAIENLKAADQDTRTLGGQWLYDLAIAVHGSTLATIITKFFGF